MSDAALTPMMQQYRELKGRDPDAVLLFRMGDFYEMFGEDAEQVAPVLGLALTSRDKGPDALPMAGFPHPALEGYLAKLVAAGLRAAVCEQVEDARLAKGLVRREIVRVVTPGTLTDDALLDPRAANYLAAVVEIKGALGLAWAELSTGAFAVEGVGRRVLLDELARLDPAELLVSETAREAPWLRLIREQAPGRPITLRPSWDFQPEQARQRLHDHFRTTTLEGFGVGDDTPEAAAAGALLAYLTETQKSALAHFTRLSPHVRGSTVGLDEMTRRGLELARTLRESRREGSLLHAIDRTCTPMGARLLGDWVTAPSTDRGTIVDRHDAVGELCGDGALRAEVRSTLERVSDLERLAGRVGTHRATPRDLVALARTLGLLPRLKALVTARGAKLLGALEAGIELCPELRSSIDEAMVPDPPLSLKEGGLIRDGYHPTLDELRDIASGGKSWITRFQAEQVRKTGIGGLKVGFNRVFGYYIEITHAQAAGRDLPADYIRKQTVKNGERYITPELKEYEDRVLRAEERARELEYELFITLRDRVAAEAPRIVQTGQALARLDVLAGLAELATRQGYCRPEIVAEPVLELDKARHPVLDVLMPQGEFVPNEVALGPDNGLLLLITGPNMAGKSTYIRQVALITLMAQMGSFVPARSARIGLVDRVFARIGATDELGRGQSTFMVEMTETANILHNATDQSLVILDEIGRGTSTFDGVSLAWAIAEHIHDHIGCRTLFATHYHELVELEKSKPRLRNANVAVLERDGDVVFLHRIVPGGADQSYGIHVARLAGVPQPVLDRAREILAYLERQHATQPPSETAGAPGPRRVKTGRAMQGSLFAALPEPLLAELRQLDLNGLDAPQALNVLRRLRDLAAS